MKTEYFYDSVGDIVRQRTTGGTNVELLYMYDRNGMLVSEQRTEAGKTVNSVYSYDALGRMASFATDREGVYRESYKYDAAGNMLEKWVNETQISMSYNAANQLTLMESANGRIAYEYNANGDMVSKTLNGEHKDRYAYDVAGNLTSYTGYDGYTVDYVYSALNMLAEKVSTGNSNRATLEEIISGKGELTETGANAETVMTRYTYDILQSYYNVLTETSNGITTEYEYGLERIAAYTATDAESVKTQYVYDVRGSVIETITGKATEHIAEITGSYAYTPYGEQLGDAYSGYGYNGEYYDAATGMVNLRARQYEPGMMRFSQPDVVRGYALTPQTVNRYAYCVNNPVMYADPSGESYTSGVGGAWSRTASILIDDYVQVAPSTVNSLVRAAKKSRKAVQSIPLPVYTGNIHNFGAEENMEYSDLSTDELRAQGIPEWYFIDEEWYRRDFYGLINGPIPRFASGEMKGVVNEMIDHFCDGTGTDYSNDVLTSQVENHPETKRFMNDFLSVFGEELIKQNGNIKGLIYSQQNRAYLPIVKGLDDNGVYLTKYSYGGGLFDRDTYSGLTLAIHSWTQVDVEVTNYKIIDGQYTGQLKYTFRDNFGLDRHDIRKFGALAGFRAWYMLQHSDELEGQYTPFYTVVEVAQDFVIAAK